MPCLRRLLQFTFVEDHFMLPDDPLGKHGPRLEDFLRRDFRCVYVCLGAMWYLSV